MKKKVKYYSFFLILTLFIILLSGCNKDSNIDIYWFRDPNGFFHTNDLKRAQEEIPFTIILPSVLPNNIDANVLKIYGPIEKNIGPYSGIEVEITYILGEKSIYIYENNIGLVMQPNPDLDPKSIDIVGITVLQQKTSLKNGISFFWGHEELSFGVRVYSIEENEGIKIVESMIKQLK